MTALYTSPASLDATAPDWPSVAELARVVAELHDRPPLVRPGDCRALRDRLAEVANGDAFIVQGGDCAELFGEVSAHTTIRKAAQLAELANLVEEGSGLPAVGVGRIAGQFAKPRSHQVEPGPVDVLLPVYRGDAVNSLVGTLAARRPDPLRMLTAYAKSAEVLSHLAEAYAETGQPVYTSHEALLLEYEAALVRTDPETGAWYASSAHLLWLGDRTRQVDGPRVELLSRIWNPVAVKLGPTATPDGVAALVDRLDPTREPGRLAFVTRLGVQRVAGLLPELVEAAHASGARPTWICDPMHGNTVRTADGRKTRALEDVLGEVVLFVRVLRAAGVHPGGIHLETTPDDVTECVDLRADAVVGRALPRYWTGCDPRLNPGQARDVVAAFVRTLGT